MTPNLSGYGVELLPVAEQHLELLRHWRNDSAISQFMVDKSEISEQQQISWFKTLCHINSQQHFVICYKDSIIGAANIKEQNQLPIINQRETNNIQDKRLKIEPGIYLGDEKFRNNVLAFAPSLVLLDYCFEQLAVSRLYAKVHVANSAALNYNRKLGYCQVSEMNSWISIELTHADYQRATEAVKQFLLRRIK